MELEVGMYVRLHGKIGKVEHICMCEQCELRGFYEPVVDFGYEGSDYVSVYWKDDLKASHNLIDLIEVGDYVNGYKITSIEEGNRRNKWVYAEDEDGYLIKSFPPKNIKSIVTKEQFSSMEYKVSE